VFTKNAFNRGAGLRGLVIFYGKKCNKIKVFTRLPFL